MERSFDVVSPFDGAVIETLGYTTPQQAEAALTRAHALFSNRDAWLDAATRIAILERLAVLVAQRAEELALIAAQEGGKPLKDSQVEITRAINGVGVAIGEIAQLKGSEVRMGLNPASMHRFAHTYLEPRGVVLAISAFNHPFNLIIHQVITAVAAGCPVLIKPALNTPRSAMTLVGMLHEAGLPEGWCQVLLTSNEHTEPLVSDTRVAFMSFIGSAKVGWHLRSKLAKGATCALEHGGLAPVIVDPTADLKDAIPLLTRGSFYHAGQVCVSVQRVYLHRSIQARFIEAFVAAAKALVVGDAILPQTDVGPIISHAQLARIHSWVQAAVAGGAEVLCGGKALSESTYAPTVLLNPPEDALISTEEIFGPVVALYTYDDLDDAVARANAPDVFFQAAVFTQDLDTALSLSRRLHGMTVMVNDHSAYRVDWMPFGGSRQSGLGLGGIGPTMHDMSVERMVVFRSKAL